VTIIIGADAEGGVRPIPIQPPLPMANSILSTQTTETVTTPTIDLRSAYEMIKITRNAIGINVAESVIDASRNALLRKTTPPVRIFTG
jgi:hypothetical protein